MWTNARPASTVFSTYVQIKFPIIRTIVYCLAQTSIYLSFYMAIALFQATLVDANKTIPINIYFDFCFSAVLPLWFGIALLSSELLYIALRCIA